MCVYMSKPGFFGLGFFEEFFFLNKSVFGIEV